MHIDAAPRRPRWCFLCRPGSSGSIRSRSAVVWNTSRVPGLMRPCADAGPHQVGRWWPRQNVYSKGQHVRELASLKAHVPSCSVRSSNQIKLPWAELRTILNPAPAYRSPRWLSARRWCCACSPALRPPRCRPCLQSHPENVSATCRRRRFTSNGVISAALLDGCGAGRRDVAVQLHAGIVLASVNTSKSCWGDG